MRVLWTAGQCGVGWVRGTQVHYGQRSCTRACACLQRIAGGSTRCWAFHRRGPERAAPAGGGGRTTATPHAATPIFVRFSTPAQPSPARITRCAPVSCHPIPSAAATEALRRQLAGTQKKKIALPAANHDAPNASAWRQMPVPSTHSVEKAPRVFFNIFLFVV